MRMASQKDKAEQLRSLKIGGGIQYLLNEAHRILGNPVLVHDMKYRLIARTENITTDDPIWNEFARRGQLSEETIVFCKNEGFIDDVANSTRQNGVTYLISDTLKYDRVFGQLYNSNHIPVADMIVIGSESPFEENILELVKVLCDVLSEELGKSAYYQDYGRVYMEELIRELLEGSIADNQIYAGHIANIDKNLKANIYVAVADIGKHDDKHAKLSYYRDLCQKTQPAFHYYLYRDYIVILMSWDSEAWPDKESGMRKLRSLFDRENIYAGISGSFENLFALKRYYANAVEALNHGLAGDGERICLYDDIKDKLEKGPLG